MEGLEDVQQAWLKKGGNIRGNLWGNILVVLCLLWLGRRIYGVEGEVFRCRAVGFDFLGEISLVGSPIPDPTRSRVY